jgi:hypothetical protein
MAVAVTRPVVISAMAVAVAGVVTVPMPVAVITVAPVIVMPPMVAVPVMNQGREPGDQRHDGVVSVMRVCGFTRHGQQEQTGRGGQLQFV